MQPRRAPASRCMKLAGLDTTGDGGLLGLALSPKYRDDRLVYAYVTTSTDNRVVRFVVASRWPRVTGIPRGRTGNGGRIEFGADGMLYVGTGDAGQPALAANPAQPGRQGAADTAFGRPARATRTRVAGLLLGHGPVAGLCVTAVRGSLQHRAGLPAADEVDQVEAEPDGWPPAAPGPRRRRPRRPGACRLRRRRGGCAMSSAGCSSPP